MSTFEGKIDEIPYISVDRFDGENRKSTIYFLSHCHSDHMQGLNDWGFQNDLVNIPDVFLYASAISVKILKHLYPPIEPKLKELPMNNSTLIKFPYREDKFLSVTLMPAGHCPGSVMFLFETDKTILYTGDYRVNASDLKKYAAFYSLGKLKKIDKMYLDTTFFKLSYSKLPSRKASMEKICNGIKEWIVQSKKHIIKIHPSAKYGSEYLFAEIAKNLCMPIHVNSQTYNLYKCIPELDEAVTTDHKITQIHAGCGNHFRQICENEQNNSSLRVVIPSTLWWENTDFDKESIELLTSRDHRVCYSCHASFEEIQEFLLFLKPLEVEPCVVPKNQKEKEDMFKLLECIMNIYKEQSIQSEDINIRLFKENVNEEASNENPSTPDKGSTSSTALDDILSSPPKSFKRRRLWLNNQEGPVQTEDINEEASNENPITPDKGGTALDEKRRRLSLNNQGEDSPN